MLTTIGASPAPSALFWKRLLLHRAELETASSERVFDVHILIVEDGPQISQSWRFQRLVTHSGNLHEAGHPLSWHG
jgi:hypothetical protein